MKKFIALSTVVIMTLTAVGCSSDKNTETPDTESTTVSIESQTELSTDEIEAETQEENTESTTRMNTAEHHPQVTDVAAFADSIKSMVVDKDMNGLSDITTFPVHINTLGDISTKEDFIALNAGDVLTPDLIEAVALLNTADLTANDNGEVIVGSGDLNITCSSIDGNLSITSYNN